METISMGQMQTLEQLERAASDLRSMQGKALRLDMSETPKLSTAALQLLLSAQKSWQADGKNLLIENMSAEAMETLNLLGFSRQFSPVREAVN